MKLLQELTIKELREELEDRAESEEGTKVELRDRLRLMLLAEGEDPETFKFAESLDYFLGIVKGIKTNGTLNVLSAKDLRSKLVFFEVTPGINWIAWKEQLRLIFLEEGEDPETFNLDNYEQIFGLREKVRYRRARKEQDANNMLSTKEACNKAAAADAVVGRGVELNVASELEVGAEAKTIARGTEPEETTRTSEACGEEMIGTSSTEALPRDVAGEEEDRRVEGVSQIRMAWAEGSSGVNRPPVAYDTMSTAKGAQEADGSVDRLESVKSQPGTEEVSQEAPGDFDAATSQSGGDLNEDTLQCLLRVEKGDEDMGTCLVKYRGREAAKQLLTKSINKAVAWGFCHTGRSWINETPTWGRSGHIRVTRRYRQKLQAFIAAMGKPVRRPTVEKESPCRGQVATSPEKKGSGTDEAKEGHGRTKEPSSQSRLKDREGKSSRNQGWRDEFHQRGIGTKERTPEPGNRTTQLTADIVYRIRKSSGRKARTSPRTSFDHRRGLNSVRDEQS